MSEMTTMVTTNHLWTLLSPYKIKRHACCW